MTFKQNWEKTDPTLYPSVELINKMINKAFSTKKIYSCKLISGGCANLNYKVYFVLESTPYILRLYLRDSEAVYREQQLSLLLKPKLPIPEVYFIGHYQGFQFALIECLSGITLRDLLLSKQNFDMAYLMYKLGTLAAQIHAYLFPSAGFFNRRLQIIQSPKSSYSEYGKECLENEWVIATLDLKIRSKIAFYLNYLDKFFPSTDEKCLVHGDFDPANILVTEENKQWKISAILDWEFAFSGSPLFDVANMLRYAHYMPASFKNSFLKGLSLSYTLPAHWQTTVNLLNLLSLLDCLTRSSANHPNQQADIYQLITYIINQFDKEYAL
ncbi:Predicted kinase [Legionella busanensis]|uniref:Predicted kinase n=1 Tax=Legionella busanensis TaxID=190655 RepID=A0A378JNZ0_9GAMM|nr:aminoglycoside phosphotransferase family protein [Legionella busanensis]STX52398.1 Predicted kinase [Legionella busanensis]